MNGIYDKVVTHKSRQRMSRNTVDSKEVSVQEKEESSLVKYKLRILLIFQTSSSNQKEKAKLFRCGKSFPKDMVENSIAEEFMGSEILYEDKDEGSGDYVIKDAKYIINENSPKAMLRLSKDVDRYIRSICELPNVSEVIPCIFVPSLGPDTCIPKLFFHFFTPECLINNTKKLTNLSVNAGGIFFLGITEAVSFVKAAFPNGGGKNGGVKADSTLIQIFVLLSYYVYFYIDLIEQKDWSFFKRDLSNEEVIQEYLDERELKEKRKEEKKEKKKEMDEWKEVKKTMNKNERKAEEKRRKAEEKKMNEEKNKNIIYWLFSPITFLIESAKFFFNYDGHLKNRIYSRIADVLKIMKRYDNRHEERKSSSAAIIISNILKESAKNKKPVDAATFFKMCGYWQYYRNDILREEIEKWKVCEDSVDMGFLSGYGAILFKRDGKKQYIYAFKGTDFDSYGRDWLLTNILQGLSGFSGQHFTAIKCAKQIDRQVGADASLWFVGHSLGGGLASAATIATPSREGYTFNAAGLNVIGTTLNKLINNATGIFRPSQCWNRVFPYRIKGEALDNIQKWVAPVILLKAWERGYGRKSVEMDVKGLSLNSGEKHGIANFLYKEVMENMQPWKQISDDKNKKESNNKVVQITFYGKESNLTAEI